MATAVLDETVGVVPFEAGAAEGFAFATEEAAAFEEVAAALLTTTTGAEVVAATAAIDVEVANVVGELEITVGATAAADVITLSPAALGDANKPGDVDMDVEVVDVVLGVAAAAVARLAGKVVKDRGTAVHRWPSIEVIENPAGRDMSRNESDASRYGECTVVKLEMTIIEAPRPSVPHDNHNFGDVCERKKNRIQQWRIRWSVDGVQETMINISNASVQKSVWSG
jgi:hypothetical protein